MVAGSRSAGSQALVDNASEAPDPPALTLVPHRGRVRTEVVAGRTWAVDTLALRRSALPDGEWEVQEDDEGYACFVAVSGDREPMLAEDVFTRTIWESETGEVFVVQRQPNGTESQWSLDDKLAFFTEVSATGIAGPTGASHAFDAYWLEWPRQGMRFWWGARCFYTHMRLDSFAGASSKWFYNIACACRSWLIGLGFSGDHVMQSAKAGKKDGQRNAAFLPKGAFSTLGVFALLARWSFAPNRRRGSVGGAPGAAPALLKCFLDGLREMEQPWVVEIRLVPQWQCPWPMQTSPGEVIRLPVDGSLSVEIAALRTAAFAVGSLSFVRKFWQVVAERVVGDTIDLVDLIEVLFANSECKPFFSQLVWSAACRLEERLAVAYRSGGMAGTSLSMKAIDLLTVIEQPWRLSNELFKHVYAGRRHFAKFTNLSFTLDKAQVCGLGLYAGGLCAPDSHAALAAVQVSKPFQSSVSKDSGLRGLALVNERHRAWVRQHAAPQGTLDAWRPRKLHRRGSLRFLKHLDTMLVVGTAWEGLGALVKSDEATWRQQNWRRWPHLGVCIDQAGEGVSALHALKYKLGANIDEWYCMSHGVHSDMNLTSQHCQTFNLKLVMLIVLNLPHGPDREEDMRWEQMCGCMQWFLENFTCKSSELFKARAPLMYQELEAAGLLQAPAGGSPDEAVWAWLKERWNSPRKGYRIKLCEFMRLHRCLKEVVDTWHTLLFEREVLGLEMDFLAGSDFKKRLAIMSSDAARAMELRTTSGLAQVDARLLRSCGRNAVSVSVLVLASPLNRRIVAIMQVSGEVMCQWEGKESKAPRNGDTARTWWLQQLAGGFVEALVETFACLTDSAAVKACGFLAFSAVPAGDQEAMRASEDELARLHGSHCLALAANRMRRCFAKLQGYPGRLFRQCLGVDEAAEAITKFKADKDFFDILSDLATPPAPLVQLLRRSPFQCTVNKQWVAAFDSTDWLPHPDATRLASDRLACFMSSELAENIFNTAKTARQVKGSTRFRKPERAMAMALARNTIERQFHMKLVPTVAIADRGLRLGLQAFGKKSRKPTFEAEGIATFQSKASYYSPKCENIGLPAADLAVAAEVSKFGLVEHMSNLDLGAVCQWKHQILVRRQNSERATAFDWHVPLFHYKGSGVVCLPVVLLDLPQYPGVQYMELMQGVSEPATIVIMSWKGLTAKEFQWLSWCSHSLVYPLAKPYLRPGTRAVVVGDEQPLAWVAAKNAFWLLDATMVQMISEHLQAGVDCRSLSADALVALIRKVLGCTEGEALDILKLRLPMLAVNDDFTDDFLNFEEALDCLSTGDEGVVRNAQERSKTKKAEYDGFVREYMACRVAYRERTQSAAAGSAGATSRAKRARTSPSDRPLSMPKEFTNLEQGFVKTFLPQGAFIWKNRHAAVWCARMPPFKEVRSRRSESESDGLRRILGIVWQQFCEVEGVALEECPMKDIDWSLLSS